ncbi:MAG: 1-deoxy-D-xylulose-5-phosphate reductoisomerase [Thermaerobacter sp.]|nr:1-deoxy-D-xylulose-5-phosphate reductoisomerase [Thermaerobacter sp.]
MNVVVLGATGSIGRQTADVVAAHPDRLRVRGLVAHRDVDGMAALVQRLQPAWVVLTDPDAAARLRVRVPAGTVVDAGMDRVITRVEDEPAATVVAAMSGFVGLAPTLAAANRGHRLGLANKETMVAAGGLIREAVRRGGGRLLPMDSEHSAIFQALGEPAHPFRRLIITATGGPFRGWDRARLAQVEAAAALNHPVWRMGRKNTVDSATLMNKGLEVLEAHWLFDAPLDQIDVVVHPEAVVHSLVEYPDGAMLAQLGMPDMRVPIQLALTWPERWEVPETPWLALAAVGRLTFEEPDHDVFPGVAIARRAGKVGGSAPVVLNAANEVAVERFLAGALRFLDISDLVADVLDGQTAAPVAGLEDILAADADARAAARAWHPGGGEGRRQHG